MNTVKNSYIVATVSVFLAVGASCRQNAAQKARVKSGKSVSLSALLAAATDKSGNLLFTIRSQNLAENAAKPEALSVVFAPIDQAAVDLTKVAQRQVVLTTLSAKLTYSSVIDWKQKFSCAGVSVPLTTQAAPISCQIVGGDNESDETITGSDLKVPANITGTIRAAWIAMARTCVAGQDKLIPGANPKELIGCDCKGTSTKFLFSAYDEYSIGSPQEANRNFQRDCGSVLGSVEDRLALKCAELKGTDNQKQGCYVCADMKDAYIDYKEFLAASDPLAAFSERVAAECK
jgi:hypothetical protein